MEWLTYTKQERQDLFLAFLLPSLLVAQNLKHVAVNVKQIAKKVKSDKFCLVTPTGFEPVIFTLKG